MLTAAAYFYINYNCYTFLLKKNISENVGLRLSIAFLFPLKIYYMEKCDNVRNFSQRYLLSIYLRFLCKFFQNKKCCF